jgi:hypothetical protein
MFQQTLRSFYQKKYCVYSEPLASVIDYNSVWATIQRTLTKVGRENIFLAVWSTFPGNRILISVLWDLRHSLQVRYDCNSVETNATRALNHSIYASCHSYIKAHVSNIIRTWIKEEKFLLTSKILFKGKNIFRLDIFSDITPCILEEVRRWVRQPLYYVHLHQKPEAARSRFEPVNRLPWDVKVLFKIHIIFLRVWVGKSWFALLTLLIPALGSPLSNRCCRCSGIVLQNGC